MPAGASRLTASWMRPVEPDCGLSSSTCRSEKSPWNPSVPGSWSVPTSSHGVKSTLLLLALISDSTPLRVFEPHQLAEASTSVADWLLTAKPLPDRSLLEIGPMLPAEAVNADIERLFLTLARGASAGQAEALRRLRLLHAAIVAREEQGETLSRLLPGGLAEKLRRERPDIGEAERVTVTVLMSDIRSYSTIAERADPTQLAGQLNTHRAAMNRAVLSEGGTVMQFVGDAVMAVFGAPFPQPDHADRAVAAAAAMHGLQSEINAGWAEDGLPAFGLGLGLSTGEAAAALLGSAERLEYTLVGDTVNRSQRLQQLADSGETVLSEGTVKALSTAADTIRLGSQRVKGREAPVVAA